MKIISIVLLTFSLFTCKSQQINNIQPFQRMENYNGNIVLPIEEKILTIPTTIINLLNEMDNVDTYSSYELNHGEKQLFMDYFDFLPLKYRNIITEKVVGIYFVKNFLGGGMTLPVFDNNGNMYMVLYFNPEILHQNISNWINFRDNSVFINNGSEISIMVECFSKYYALLHTLVHEACHIYDYYNSITPFTEKFLKNDQTRFPTDFVRDVWADYDKPIDKFDYMDRENISFYDLGERISINNAMRIFDTLRNTPFTSLYGSKTRAEDFAEAFTWYYLNKYFETDYITIIFENDEPLMIYDMDENDLVKGRYRLFIEIEE